jgi:hypothetical protein
MDVPSQRMRERGEESRRLKSRNTQLSQIIKLYSSMRSDSLGHSCAVLTARSRLFVAATTRHWRPRGRSRLEEAPDAPARLLAAAARARNDHGIFYGGESGQYPNCDSGS